MEHVSLIYSLLALHLTIPQANLMLHQMGFPDARVSGPAQITAWGAMSPTSFAGGNRGFHSYLATTNFTFSISKEDIIFVRIHRSQGGEIEDWRDGDGTIGVPRDNVGEKRAYQLARGWLESIGVDVAAMERKNRVEIQHQVLPLTNAKTVSSEFRVHWARHGWRSSSAPVATVYLNETENWLVRLHLRDLSYYRRPLPEVPCAEDLNLLPDEPVLELLSFKPHSQLAGLLAQPPPNYTNAFKLLDTSPGYEEEQYKRLRSAAKEVFAALQLDESDELEEGNPVGQYVYPPAFGSGGRLKFKKSELRFDGRGKLKYFLLSPCALADQAGYEAWWRTAKSVISTNEAYQLVTQKLAALSIDVEKLNRDCNRTFRQAQRWGPEKKQQRVCHEVALFCLEWQPKSSVSSSAVGRVTIYGDTRKIGYIELNDTSYCRHRYLEAPEPTPSEPALRQ